MKILAFADQHGDKAAIKKVLERAKEADLLVCAGDISEWGQNEREILKELQKAGKPMLLIPGNHELEEELKEIAKEFDYVIYLHKGSYKFGEYVFFGYGGGGFAHENKEFERIAKQFQKTIPENAKVILITHGPPYGTELDYIHDRHTGCKSITKFIETVKPILSISGHLHESFGIKQVVGKTLVINPGPQGKMLII